jgi:hypothetical protein
MSVTYWYCGRNPSSPAARGIPPGQRTTNGTRMPPAYVSPLKRRNGVLETIPQPAG